MTTLLADVAQEMAKANQLAASSLTEEARRAERLREHAERLSGVQAEWGTFQRRVARIARAAIRDVVGGTQEVSDLWSAAVQALREGLPQEDQLDLLRALAGLAESVRAFQEVVRRFCAFAAQFGNEVDEVPALDEARRTLDRIGAEATRAIEARTNPWQPRDPERLARGLAQVQEGKLLSPDEMLNHFRRQPSADRP